MNITKLAPLTAAQTSALFDASFDYYADAAFTASELADAWGFEPDADVDPVIELNPVVLDHSVDSARFDVDDLELSQPSYALELTY